MKLEESKSDIKEVAKEGPKKIWGDLVKKCIEALGNGVYLKNE